ncbi:MAG: 3-hydroxyacyl-CoA dehydrogenase family protein [Deltaproteobacteria bacterium]|nr:MAG: 3-hydroxyacyl-CoA dehydrogenase family protein [Deltaproteobacteria bacterium]
MPKRVAFEDIATVTVIGAGTMGHGIAQVCAMAGYRTWLCDVDRAVAERAVARVRANLDKGIARGKVTEADRDAALARLAVADSIGAAAAESQLVIEAAPEKMDIKQALFREAEETAPAGALFGTNTSSLSIGGIASAVADPGRVVGLHFFNPVHIMKLLEIVRHEHNDDATIETCRRFAERIGKTPVVVKDVPGFATSRLGVAVGLEAIRMVEEGVASAADIDTAMRLGYGYPMGPLELSDLVGLDIRLHIADYLRDTLGERFEAPALLRDMVAAGKLGKKSGEGFYRWVDGKKV